MKRSFYVTSNYNLVHNLHTKHYLPAEWMGLLANAAVWTGVDRTGVLEGRIRYVVRDCDRIPEQIHTKATLEEIVTNRAEYLLKKHKDKNIYLSWSGGIDSTLALVSLLKAGADKLDNFTIVMEDKSIEEYPLFFNNFIDKKLSYTVHSTNFRPRMILGDHSVTISGELGDQIMGSSLAVHNYLDYINMPWKETLEKIAFFPNLKNPRTGIPGLFLLSDEGKKMAMPLLEYYVDQSPIDIKTTYDFLWWLNFSMKWCILKHADFTVYYKSNKLTPEEFDSREPFYDDAELQRWSMTNPDLKIKKTEASYKWTFKDLIYKYTKDADYRDHKLKVLSAPSETSLNTSHLNTTTTRMSVDNNLNLISAAELSKPEILKQFLN